MKYFLLSIVFIFISSSSFGREVSFAGGRAVFELPAVFEIVKNDGRSLHANFGKEGYNHLRVGLVKKSTNSTMVEEFLKNEASLKGINYKEIKSSLVLKDRDENHTIEGKPYRVQAWFVGSEEALFVVVVERSLPLEPIPSLPLNTHLESIFETLKLFRPNKSVLDDV